MSTIDYRLGASENENDFKKAPVANVECEAALLGALMIENRLIDDIGSYLTPEDFFEPLHQRAFKIIVYLRGSGELATPITLRPYFAGDGPVNFVEVDDTGMRKSIWIEVPSYLARLTGSGAGLIGAREFAKQIRALALQRRVRDTVIAGIETLNETGEEISPTEKAADLAAAIMMAAESEAQAKVRTAADMMGGIRRRQQTMKEGKGIGATCRTIPDLNDLIGPLTPKTMTIIAGRPSMGKSVLAQSIGWGCAVNQHPTLVISQEMSEDALADRLAADVTHGMGEAVPYRSIQRGTLTESELLCIDEAQKRVDAIPLSTISPERATIEEIESIVALHVGKLARADKKLEVLIVDYIQIIGTTKKKDPREALNYVSERLLRLSKRYSMAVLVLSQLNRDVEKRPDKRPQLSDLKESGRLEEDADNVLFVYRAEYYLERERPEKDAKGYEDWMVEYEAARGRVDLIAGKSRGNEIGTKRLRWFGANQAIRGSAWRPIDIGERSDLI
jgi:replicative DNA helicase